MKKQKSKKVAVSEFSEMVQSHKNVEVSPPDTAKRVDSETGEIRTVDKVKEMSVWMNQAKEASREKNKGFLNVSKEILPPTYGIDKQMLYRGKKKD